MAFPSRLRPIPSRPPGREQGGNRFQGPLSLVLLLLLFGTGCHPEGELPPLSTRLIAMTDKFFDVHALDAEQALVVGYGGKILRTEDGGYTWTRVASGTTAALYRVRFLDHQRGWICGQNGTLLHSTDGGRSWQPRTSGTSAYLFSLHFSDPLHGWAVGDKSMAVTTSDGGITWHLRKIHPRRDREDVPEMVLAGEDPVLYDVHFANPDTGWVTGEFGQLLRTSDGGRSWTAHEETLLGDEIVDRLDIPTFFGLSFSSPTTGLATGLEGRVVTTTDGGRTWQFAPRRLDYPVVAPLFSAHLFPDGSGWAIGAGGEVLRREAPEAAWQRASLGMEVVTWLRAMSWLDPQNGWIVGGYGLILRTRDGGRTWIPAIG